MKTKWSLSLALLLLLSLGACGQVQIGIEDETTPTEPVSGLPNPASVYCIEAGYELEIRTGEDGGQYGVCIFPDGSECEEWAYFRGECSPRGTPEVIMVAGWLGSVRTVTEDDTYDDALVLWPEDIGEIGLTGVNPTVEDDIIALRDVEPPGKYAHFWGTLTCEGEDVGGCQLVVDRIRVGATQTSGDRVENWEGTIETEEFNGGPSPTFVLSGSFPMLFSIHSNDAELLALIESLQGTGALVRVSGELLTGIPDVNGARIQAEQIELIAQP